MSLKGGEFLDYLLKKDLGGGGNFLLLSPSNLEFSFSVTKLHQLLRLCSNNEEQENVKAKGTLLLHMSLITSRHDAGN
jgi:hypothetical protein